jgi:hypothetical protein
MSEKYSILDHVLAYLLIAGVLGLFFCFVHLILDHVFNVLKDWDTTYVFLFSVIAVATVGIACFFMTEDDEDCQ